MSDESDRFSLTAEQYLAKYHVLTYLQDAVAQLLEHKEENPRVIPARFLSDYFRSVVQGNHTLFREYNYIKKTPHNIASFIRVFWKCFRHIGRNGDLLSAKEYHSLVCLLCPDFPFEPVQKTARIILMEDAMDCLMSFPDFLYAFQTQFFYEEFIEKLQSTYQALISGTYRPGQIVIVPTLSRPIQHKTQQQPAHTAPDAVQVSSGDGVEVHSFLEAILQIIHSSNGSFRHSKTYLNYFFLSWAWVTNVPNLLFDEQASNFYHLSLSILYLYQMCLIFLILVGCMTFVTLRWLNTVFARAFADGIQRSHKDYKKQTCHQ